MANIGLAILNELSPESKKNMDMGFLGKDFMNYKVTVEISFQAETDDEARDVAMDLNLNGISDWATQCLETAHMSTITKIENQTTNIEVSVEEPENEDDDDDNDGDEIESDSDGLELEFDDDEIDDEDEDEEDDLEDDEDLFDTDDEVDEYDDED